MKQGLPNYKFDQAFQFVFITLITGVGIGVSVSLVASIFVAGLDFLLNSVMQWMVICH